GCGGNMNAEYYANLYKQYATYMMGFAERDKMFRVASGPAGGDYNWTEVLMKNVPLHLMEGIALHYYAVIDWNKKGHSVNFGEEHYFKTMQQAWKMDEYVRGHAAVMDKWDKEKKLALIVDEWGGWYDVEPGTNPGFLYQQNTVRDAMIAGMTLNIFNNNSDRVRMANLAQTVNVLQAVILTDKEKMILTPTYHVMEMYTVHHDAQLLPLQIKSADYVFGGEKLPAVNGSASKDAQGRTHVSLVNIDAAKPQKIIINIDGANFKSVSGRILSSPKLQDHNTFEQPEKIKPLAFTGAKISGNKLEITLPPASVVVLQLQ
ncbi:MAG: alpha-N-arabinofuranosidase, partial [Chitinophagaceae bacterium]